MKKLLLGLVGISCLSLSLFFFNEKAPLQQLRLPRNVEGDAIAGREAWELQRLADPATGKIPAGIRAKELAFAAQLPTDAYSKSNDRFDYNPIGPFNIGGRTRAFAMDVANENTLLAGGVSGGMWKSTDGGATWYRTTAIGDLKSVTCLTQDKRAGKTSTWYFGSGEGIGNSASKSFSAYYLGDGVFKSTDNGETWTSLAATATGTPHVNDEWDRMWNIAVNNANTTEDEVFAAINGKIMRSTDGGLTWNAVLGNSGVKSYYTDVNCTSSGVTYATLDSDGSNKGIWRSTDGITFTNITPTSGFPSTYDRIVSGIDPNNENVVYFLARTFSIGQLSNPNSASGERNMLWRYTYQSGTGSGTGGLWEDLSANLPSTPDFNSTFTTQGSYDMVVAVRPGFSNVVFIGGSNIFRSTDAFNTPNNIKSAGGYNPGSKESFSYRYENHHPDQHIIFFSPSNNATMFNANDGGIYKTLDCMKDSVEWIELNNGYTNSQFYTVAVDKTAESKIVLGGLQDNGTQWTNSDNFNQPWAQPNLGDGSYCAAVGDGTYIMSRQNGSTIRAAVDNNGNLTGYRRIDGAGITGYIFVNPLVLDRNNSNLLYMAAGDSLVRYPDLTQYAFTNENSKPNFGFEKLGPLNSSSFTITALETSSTPANILYIGTSNRRVYKLENANTTAAAAVNITNNISSGTYVSSIACNPNDANEVMVVYSNYNVVSLWHSTDGGNTWTNSGGNLEETVPVGTPAGIGNGPSCRWAKIIPTAKGTVYLVGTSVGLFATRFLDGENTIWTQQATDVIGNTIVDMIDTRYSDGYTAIATHGNGVYATYIDDADKVTSVASIQNNTQLFESSIYPNPTSTSSTLKINAFDDGALTFEIYDLQGKRVLAKNNVALVKGNNIVQLPFGELMQGAYFVKVSLAGKTETHKVIKY